jgi:hypothetical protein
VLCALRAFRRDSMFFLQCQQRKKKLTKGNNLIHELIARSLSNSNEWKVKENIPFYLRLKKYFRKSFFCVTFCSLSHVLWIFPITLTFSSHHRCMNTKRSINLKLKLRCKSIWLTASHILWRKNVFFLLLSICSCQHLSTPSSTSLSLANLHIIHITPAEKKRDLLLLNWIYVSTTER